VNPRAAVPCAPTITTTTTWPEARTGFCTHSRDALQIPTLLQMLKPIQHSPLRPGLGALPLARTPGEGVGALLMHVRTEGVRARKEPGLRRISQCFHPSATPQTSTMPPSCVVRASALSASQRRPGGEWLGFPDWWRVYRALAGLFSLVPPAADI